jgi:trehalose 6-phosphate synthase/phosphatase
MTSHRLLIASNRLPVSAQVAREGVRLVPSGGGLATGMRAWHEQSDAVWFGWPGDVTRATAAQRQQLDRELHERRIVPVHLSDDQVSGYYDGYANRVLWPVFHYLVGQLPLDAAGWNAYRDVNEAFADVIAREHRPGDIVWVHDYHLMLLPALLRARLPHERIGFFLHIPFPSSEVFRVLPRRRELLDGLLGADVIGFHTFAYMRHFMTSLLHLEGIEADIDRIWTRGREIALGVFPMGVDAAAFGRLAADGDVKARVEAIRGEAGGRRIVLGVDRLDYTKGIPHRLAAIESLLDRHPALRDSLRYIQIAVPSRGTVDAYQQLRKTVEERVGHINGGYGSVGSSPVHYMHRSVSPEDLAALYCAADVMLVTPLRDGMNLVAKEFVAARGDEDGVLVLSEFAGAAEELNGAITVNPYDVESVADAIHRAISMPAEERRCRMRGLRRCVLRHDVHSWAAAFVERLSGDRSPRVPAAGVQSNPSVFGALLRARRAGSLCLLLDYDGTLVPLARSPELAAPDNELLVMLEQLATAPGIDLGIVSGRPRETLERWFSALPMTLWAEHGFWHRAAHRGAPWSATASVPPGWMTRVRPILDRFAATTPGSHVEVKTASMAWHYREAPREFGARRAHELRMLLGDVLSNQPLEVLEGKKIIEVRLRGVSKAVVAQRVAAGLVPGTTIVAIGDDRTDEELFRALPASSISAAVGRPWTSAAYRLDDHRAVRRLLHSLLTEEPCDASSRAGELDSLAISV